jgi:4-hydroxy-tetrahydrodipicolinate synthase
MNFSTKTLKGTGVAVVTPFNEDYSIDIDSINKIVDFLIDNGVDYIVVQGTTGEASTLSKEEKKISRLAFVSANKRRVPLILGLGSNDTLSIIKDLVNINFFGFSAILSVTPFYNKPSQQGLYKHYSEISKASPLPIILYNVPSRTGINMLPDTTINLAVNHSNIIGIKEACGDLNQINQLITERPKDFMIISGDDDTAVETVLMGGDGVISVAAGCIPKYFSEIIQLALDKNKNLSQKKFNSIKHLIKLLFEEGNPSGIKSALSSMNLCKNILRLPLTVVSNDLGLNIKNSISLFYK